MAGKTAYAEKIKSFALQLGFDDCGISKAAILADDSRRLERWLEQDMHAGMKYMENHFVKRTDPRELVPGARSVISVLLNYYPGKVQERENTPRVSKYAYGKDYHQLIKEKLKKLLQLMQSEFGNIRGRAFVDSAPVLDRAWAARSGLGWIGKNSMLISKKYGSFVFIGELITDLNIATRKNLPEGNTGDNIESVAKDYCGSCTRCIDACPTGAITRPYLIDSRKCISYLSIEEKGDIPVSFKDKLNNWIFGCDICQDVCPWNNKAVIHSTEEFRTGAELQDMDKEDWQGMSRGEFDKLFAGSALQRAGYDKIKRNLDFLYS